MTSLVTHLLIFSLTRASLCPIGAVLLPSSGLDLGYSQMYNLQFEEAHQTFQVWVQTHPQDPMGPTSDAAACLFAEFDRLGVLQAELFLNDDRFKQRQTEKPDPVAKRELEKALTTSEQLADAILQQASQDGNALLAKVLNLGLKADYLALVEKRDLASLSVMKSAGVLAEKLLAFNPTCYDAYLAVGVENYMLSLTPAPVRWLLRLYGAGTDKEQGLKMLQLTAERGHYLLPYARLLLAIAALRDKNEDQAKELLAGLAQEFPNNPLYRRELTRLLRRDS